MNKDKCNHHYIRRVYGNMENRVFSSDREWEVVMEDLLKKSSLNSARWRNRN
jgi:hypothetical protein